MHFFLCVLDWVISHRHNQEQGTAEELCLSKTLISPCCLSPSLWADELLLIDLTDAALVITHYPAPGKGFNGAMDKALPTAVMPGSSLTRPWLDTRRNLAAPGTL